MNLISNFRWTGVCDTHEEECSLSDASLRSLKIILAIIITTNNNNTIIDDDNNINIIIIVIMITMIKL